MDEQAAVEKRQIEAARANLLEEQNRLRGTTGADSQLQAIQQRLSELGVALAAAGTDLGIAERADAAGGALLAEAGPQRRARRSSSACSSASSSRSAATSSSRASPASASSAA